ncbi:MAG: alanine--tRNA ligase [Acidilobaceae archaeon]
MVSVEVDPREYEVEFFKEMGFARLRGSRCGDYYWTLNPDFVEPQDAPCVEYWFDSIKSRGGLSVSEARRVFIDFFVNRGHAYVSPRPVVARWREDLYLTIASIVVFQPHVTNGIVPPPANPLVISQPSIRLEDIDNVGLTLGRHLTIFEMAAHHAFNYPDKYIYWKDETVRYAYEFFTKEIGVPGDMLVFKESWWEGGGNAGPCFEVAVGGLELATLVFMTYKVVDGRYERIPIMIVDTGYGVERISWFTQKTPTAFHAIYGDLVGKFRDIIGLERPDDTILWAAFKAAGRLDPGSSESINEYYTRVSNTTGLDYASIRRILLDEARFYSLLDHTKTLALMLADGIVPSNAGEGYLARLVARRALKQLRLLGSNASLVDLVDLQVDYWGRDFRQLLENRDYILEAVSLEESRFKELIERSRRVLEREISKTRSITVNDLIRYYDSLGVHPELVAEVAGSLGVKIDIPRNFYSLVASMHKSPPRIKGYTETIGLSRDVIDWATQFKPTRKVYYENPYASSFEGKVLGVLGNYVILDATIFYPTGGGQIHDTGFLVVGDRRINVVNVVSVGDVIVHVVEPSPGDIVGLSVKEIIDWERRFKIMRHHTATHVILGAARRVLGPHVWQAGAEKTEEKGRLDITHHKPLTRDEIRKIEKLANMVINQRRRVTAKYMDRNEAESIYGLTLYQGGVPMTRTIRVIEIDDWDVEACGGTHLENTGDLGGIKIVNVERIQDGVVRLEYVAGTRVVDLATDFEDKLKEIASIIGASRGLEVEKVRALASTIISLKETLESYRRHWTKSIIEELKSIEPINGIKILVKDSIESSREALQEILRVVTDSEPAALIVVAIRGDDATNIELAAGARVAEAIDVGHLAKSIASKLNGRGGGSKSYGSVRIPASVSLDSIKYFIEESIRGSL